MNILPSFVGIVSITVVFQYGHWRRRSRIIFIAEFPVGSLLMLRLLLIPIDQMPCELKLNDSRTSTLRHNLIYSSFQTHF